MLGSFMGAPPSALTCSDGHENFWAGTIANMTVQRIQNTIAGKPCHPLLLLITISFYYCVMLYRRR
jgi:hypothetical protein